MYELKINAAVEGIFGTLNYRDEFWFSLKLREIKSVPGVVPLSSLDTVGRSEHKDAQRSFLRGTDPSVGNGREESGEERIFFRLSAKVGRKGEKRQ